jgi:hypothetical protein
MIGRGKDVKEIRAIINAGISRQNQAPIRTDQWQATVRPRRVSAAL